MDHDDTQQAWGRTDIERLHAVVSGEVHGCGSGKTYALCHAVASALDLGEAEVLCLLPQDSWRQHVTPMLVDVLLERGYTVFTPYFGRFLTVWEGGPPERTVKFTVFREEALRGYHGGVVDFNEEVPE